MKIAICDDDIRYCGRLENMLLKIKDDTKIRS